MDDNELDRLFGNEPEDAASDTEEEKKKAPEKESPDESAEVKGFVVSQYDGPADDAGDFHGWDLYIPSVLERVIVCNGLHQ